MVGSYVMADFLRQGRMLAVLARGKGKQSASQRVEQILQRFENSWNIVLDRPRVVDADLNQPNLGISIADAQWIAQNCGQIVHSAASLSFAPADESADNEPYRTNVDGTRRVLELCGKTGIRQFHHVSTAYVCGTRSGIVSELESELGQEFANDYERSKTIAETMLHQARGSGALDCLTIYRPSIVIDRTGLSPISGDRTIYGAFSMYQMLASRFGLPDHGQWFSNLGFLGSERKNIVDVDWIAHAINVIVSTKKYHDATYHLTTQRGTSVASLDAAFRIATEDWLNRPSRVQRTKRPAPDQTPKTGDLSGSQKAELDRMAAPFVKTFLPYFRDDPKFGRDQIDRVIAETDLPSTPEIDTDELLEMVRHWSAFVPTPQPAAQTQPNLSTQPSSSNRPAGKTPVVRETSPQGPTADPTTGEFGCESEAPDNADEIVICGYEVRLPGRVENANDFEKMLWEGRSGIEPMPADRLDRSLYFDSARGVPGKTYTQLGGCVTPTPLDPNREQRIHEIGDFDLAHRQFAQVAMSAVQATFGVDCIDQISGIDPQRAGVLVGHSGGTQSGGPLAMGSLAAAAVEMVEETDLAQALDRASMRACKADLIESIQRNRPRWKTDGSPHFNAYSVASLTGSLIGFRGRREVIDAACSSSLLALHHAVSAIKADRLDLALVGGATFNNVDNLALFSQSGACSDEGCYPFDRRASGLISSEGYVALVLVRRSLAEELGLTVHGEVVGVGVASDGKGKGLWAPRSEGQQLAVRRANPGDSSRVLDLDYLECHATSTQVGDATELQSLTALLRSEGGSSKRQTRVNEPLQIGSVKSNLGHLLEAAGLVGMVKCLLAMRCGELPPSINFEQPTDSYEWSDGVVQVVDSARPWPPRNQSSNRVAGVNAFGIGGLNAHAVIRQPQNSSTVSSSRGRTRATHQAAEPIAIVGRGLIVPGADDMKSFAKLLREGTSRVADPPLGRWPTPISGSGWIGVSDGDGSVPHCRGAYIEDFQFDAQSYRIPPKTVQFANPVQLMLIKATTQAVLEAGVVSDARSIQDLNRGEWSIDRRRLGVTIGSIFGGEFSNALQIGLRVPELQEHVRKAARQQHLSHTAVERIAKQLRDALMQRYPALLDETGGFTASTLASRIARTFDLMGGACAVDADEASGGLAVLTSLEQLRQKHVDAVLCGMSHRSMDLVAFEQLHRRNQLVRSGGVKDLPKDGSQIFPGEGVAIMMLQRLSDAVAQGRPVLGIIEGDQESWTDDVVRSRQVAMQASLARDRTPAPQLVSQIGHLGGGQGILQTITATIAFSDGASKSGSQGICETARDGYQIRYQITQPTTSNQMNRLSALTAKRPFELKSELNSNNLPLSAPTERSRIDTATQLIQVRLEAGSLQQIEQDLQRLAAQPGQSVESQVTSFASSDSSAPLIQAAIVGRHAAEISRASQALLAGPIRKRHTSALAKDCAWLRVIDSSHDQAGPVNRVAWLFPGQGSQYAAIPSLLRNDTNLETLATSQAFLDDVDLRLQQRGIEKVSHRLDDPEGLLGHDVWWTQLWVLAVGAAMTDSLKQRGHRPDVVLGHSFGECTAAWAAGVMSIEQALEFAKCRSDAVIMTRQVGGELLSVRGEPSAVQAVIDRHQLETVISHHNSPTNTVVAGHRDEIAKAKQHLSAAGLASVVIHVPAAFHTPQMRPAQDLLRARFGGQQLTPPHCGFLSAVSNRYLAEPTDILDNLIDQLTQPVCFNGALERIVQQGCGLLIEVGPENILTRLARATVDGRAMCLSADDRARDYASQQALIDLACEAFQGPRSASPNAGETIRSGDAVSSSLPTVAMVERRPALRNGTALASPLPTAPESPATNSFEVVDVTRQRRRSTEATDRIDTSSSVTAHQATSQASQPHVHGAPDPVWPTSESQVAQSQASVSSAIDLNAAKSFLFDLVVDLTGYDPEIIEFDADLEAELGVDSIKKAQLIGEMIQWADAPIETQSMQLAQFETLNDIVGILGSAGANDRLGFEGPSLLESVALDTVNGQQKVEFDIPDSYFENNIADDVKSTPIAAADQLSLSESLQRLIIDLVVDQTGYDESIIDMEADMEGELGIDSIKKAQLLGELEQQYQLQSIRETNLTLADFATLGSIRDFVWEQISDSPVAVTDNTHAATSFDEDISESLQKKKNESDSEVIPPVPASGTHRFEIRTRPAPRLEGMPTSPKFHGPALVLGDNALSAAIIARWNRDPESAKYAIESVESSLTAEQLELKLDDVWRHGVSPHLFIATPHDDDGVWSTMDSEAWKSRRQAALSNPFRVCQRWMQGLIDTDKMQQGSLVTVVRGGGRLGFIDADQLNENASFHVSAESGGMAGLTKAMLIEAWMRGHRDTPMLVVDTIDHATHDEIVEGIWRELAVPSYDEEVVVAGAKRLATCAHYRPLSLADNAADLPSLTRGGNWVIAGGGRGITALTAMELAARHGLKLHLLGTAPVPQIDDQIRQRAAADRGDLRRLVMTQIQSKGGNPVTAWQKMEKAIEIDQTLQACRERSIEAAYHSVDVSDVQAVRECLQNIRESHGPIHGVIQGAGAGQDARFDRKRPDKVEKCFRAKIDGCISLADATRNDPLEWFIGFGSISGRFGANGHTDYSAANDMLAKLIGNLKRQRPQTRCVTFHWHAWGDIGMATKPEAKLALDMIGMEFMPAEQGLQHFLNEVEHGGDLTEVLITDRRYVRKFFPSGEAVGAGNLDEPLPMLDPGGKRGETRLPHNASAGNPDLSYVVTLDPTTDRFLAEHLVMGRPTMPFVMAIEMLAEAAIAGQSDSSAGNRRLVACYDVQAHQPLKCLTPDSFAVELVTLDPASERWSLVSDLRRRDGRLVQAARPHFSASFQFGDAVNRGACQPDELATSIQVDFQPIEYLPVEGPVYHGPHLQCLREIGFDDEQSVAIGLVVAPSPAHLASEERPLRGWVISPASMDAVLYAAGMLAYRKSGRPSLPVSFERIEMGRLPQPGEPLRVIVRVQEETADGLMLTALLAGQNNDCLLRISGYKIGWLG